MPCPDYFEPAEGLVRCPHCEHEQPRKLASSKVHLLWQGKIPLMEVECRCIICDHEWKLAREFSRYGNLLDKKDKK